MKGNEFRWKASGSRSGAIRIATSLYRLPRSAGNTRSSSASRAATTSRTATAATVRLSTISRSTPARCYTTTITSVFAIFWRRSSMPHRRCLCPRIWSAKRKSRKRSRPHDEANARFSRSIVKKCLETNAAFLSDDASADKRLPLSQSVVDFRIRSVMCAPLSGAEGKAFGVIQLDTQDRSKKFTQDDLTLLLGVCNVASISLENARMHEGRLAQERVRRDLELAHRVQLSFLPAKLPEVPGYEFAAQYEPAQEVGGDYYDFIPLTDKKLAVTLGDVAGKGVPAALLMAK